MKRLLLFAALMAICVTAASAEVQYHLFWNGTSNAFGTVQQGEPAELWVRMFADAGENVAGARYDVQLPMEGWDLTSRDYGTYGWFEEDGFWDGSIPVPSATPITVNNATYNGGDANTPDFLFNTARDPFGDTVTGWATTEVFEISAPNDAPLGQHTISLANTYAYDLLGQQLTSSGEDLDLAVTPEPVSALLLLTGLGIVGGLKRRNRSA